MTGRRRQRLTLMDLGILVAATAAGCALARAAFPGFATVSGGPVLTVVWGWPAVVLTAWTFAWVGLRLRPPRPRLRVLVRRPGSAAGFAAAAALACGVVFWAIVTTMRGSWPKNPWYNFQFFGSLYWTWAGPAVLGAWLVLGLGPGRSRRADWVDRLGLGLGLYWASWVLAEAARPLLHQISPSLY